MYSTSKPLNILYICNWYWILLFLRDFTKALITFPKPVIAVVNGPAVGLGMAMLPLCDIVYASDKATFYLPYSALSQTPEGCASYTLPQSVGMAMVRDQKGKCQRVGSVISDNWLLIFLLIAWMQTEDCKQCVL